MFVDIFDPHEHIVGPVWNCREIALSRIANAVENCAGERLLSKVVGRLAPQKREFQVRVNLRFIQPVEEVENLRQLLLNVRSIIARNARAENDERILKRTLQPKIGLLQKTLLFETLAVNPVFLIALRTMSDTTAASTGSQTIEKYHW